ncbi:hypothetical protein ACS0TY_000194 [Phlomoides rotata]
MASYAAVLSLMNTLNQINKHPSPPISLDPEQLQSLTQNLTFFQDFLERHSSTGEEDGDVLESRIAAAAYAAEDVIESHIVDRIHAGSNISTVDLSQGLQEMNLIKNEVMEIKKVKNMGDQNYDQLYTYPSVSASAWQNSTMVDLEIDEDLLFEVLDKLIGQCDFRIIPIVGMGGIGKTTLVRNIYRKPLIVEHFDILVWVTISQQYSVSQILLEVLSQESKGSEISESELGERVHKKLWGRRYLIVMDDIWSNESWDKVKSFFPNNNNGSRIMITTRLSNLAFDLSGSQVIEMDFLDENESWNLLCEIVFGKELDSPSELENIGMEIARNCRGLPLSIVVIGGFLKKSNRTQAHWKDTLQNLNSLINLEHEEYCLQILRMSYKELPIHLKPCFLYLGVFREDYEFHVSYLIKLWVAEGILRPAANKMLEEVAEECIEELIDRNLILVYDLRWNGKIKVCKIHDLLRDLCIKEAQKQSFLRVLKHERGVDIPECMNMERRICIHHHIQEEYSPEFFHALESASLARSLILTWDWRIELQSLSCRLLRVYSEVQENSGNGSVEAIFQNANLRCLIIDLNLDIISRIPSWMILWNVQTLKIDNQYYNPIIAPPEIWEMSLLRHVIISILELPDPVGGENDLILKDLQTLSYVRNFKLSQEVIKRIPNLKTLKLNYEIFDGRTECVDCSVKNFGHLKKLQSLNLVVNALVFFDGVHQRYSVQNMSLPHSLKKLSLRGTMLNWEECSTKIGSLPLLEYLRLDASACCGQEWETVEGQFCSLKFLQIIECDELKYWRTDSTHFPRLENLLLQNIEELEEIPLSIGDIPTLELIELENCSTSVEDSAKRIRAEQVELGNEDLQVIFCVSESFDLQFQKTKIGDKYYWCAAHRLAPRFLEMPW